MTQNWLGTTMLHLAHLTRCWTFSTVFVLVTSFFDNLLYPSTIFSDQTHRTPETSILIDANKYKYSNEGVPNWQPVGLHGPLKPFTQLTKFSLHLLMWTGKKDHYNYRWNLLIFNIQIWCSSFLLDASSISIRNMCFHLDNYPTSSPHPVCLVLHTVGDTPLKKLDVMSHFGCGAGVRQMYTYHYQQLSSKMKQTKCLLYLQLSNYHLSDVLFLSTSSFYPDITSFCDCIYQMSH